MWFGITSEILSKMRNDAFLGQAHTQLDPCSIIWSVNLLIKHYEKWQFRPCSYECKFCSGQLKCFAGLINNLIVKHLCLHWYSMHTMWVVLHDTRGLSKIPRMAFIYLINQQHVRVEFPMDWRCPLRLTSSGSSIILKVSTTPTRIINNLFSIAKC